MTNFTKITVQEMKGDFKSSMGTNFAEYVINGGTAIPEGYVKVENVTYKRVGGNKALFQVHAYNVRMNERVVSFEMYCTRICA